MKKIRYTYILSPLFGCILTLIASFVHKAAGGSNITAKEALLPFVVGTTVGLLIGILLDKNRNNLERLQRANDLLKKEISRRCQLEDRYASLFEYNHSVILLVDPESGAINDANPAAARFYGYPRSELKKMNIFEINTLSEELTRKELQKADRDKRVKFNFKHRLSSGEIRDVEVYTGPITLEGKAYFLSIINDITELKQLKGIIPICSNCKQIRDDKGAWNKLEAYISNHSEADFSHGICPECISQLYPDINLEEQKGDAAK